MEAVEAPTGHRRSPKQVVPCCFGRFHRLARQNVSCGGFCWRISTIHVGMVQESIPPRNASLTPFLAHSARRH